MSIEDVTNWEIVRIERDSLGNAEETVVGESYHHENAQERLDEEFLNDGNPDTFYYIRAKATPDTGSYSPPAPEPQIEVVRIVSDITFGTAVCDAKLSSALSQGWEILDISTVSDASNLNDGIWRQYITQVITMKRTVSHSSADETEHDFDNSGF